MKQITIEDMLNQTIPKHSLIHKTRQSEILISFDNFKDMGKYLRNRENYQRSDIRVLRL